MGVCERSGIARDRSFKRRARNLFASARDGRRKAVHQLYSQPGSPNEVIRCQLKTKELNYSVKNANSKFYFVAILVGGWWVFCALLQFGIMRYYGVAVRESIIDSITMSTALTMAGYIMISTVKYFR